jgi:ABC-2 type transport system ATP-binding protein
MDALVTESICKSYDGIVAVRDLSLSVPAGCIYGFLGPNGAGKTTALRMVMNIIYPDSGSIRVLGEPSIARAKDRVGYMPEERGLYPRMTVGAVLTYLGELKGMDRRAAEAAVRTWLKEVELADWAARKVHDLSRGMQQRLQFVATVLHGPDLLILDEPFSGLDPVNTELVRSIMLRLRDSGCTIVLSTHMMEAAESLCDRILLVDGGRKVLDGSLDEVRARYEVGCVAADLEGETDFIAALPMVTSVARNGRELDIMLSGPDQDQALLAALVGRVRVRAFRLKTPTLREVFVKAVRDHDA